MVNEKIKTKQKKHNKFMKKLSAGIVATGTMCSALAMSASATTYNNEADIGTDGINNVINILLTISKYVGIALVVYGAYEIVMSFMQNQPEAKTKGIIMALSGAVMIGLPTIVDLFL